jgi:hypothetical protein
VTFPWLVSIYYQVSFAGESDICAVQPMNKQECDIRLMTMTVVIMVLRRCGHWFVSAGIVKGPDCGSCCHRDRWVIAASTEHDLRPRFFAQVCCIPSVMLCFEPSMQSSNHCDQEAFTPMMVLELIGF